MKNGIKTFPFAVDLDDSVKLIETEFGCKGFAVYVKLLQAIHSRGYYMNWDNDSQLLFTRDYCLSEVGRGAISEIVARCISRGVFDSSLYEKYHILTSKRIQETYLTATKRSTQVILDERYALPIVYTFIENASKNGKTVNIFLKNESNLPCKGKERKEKKSKGEEKDDCRHLKRKDDNDDISSLPVNTSFDRQAYDKFVERFDILVDNYDGVKITDMDFTELYKAYENSKNFLQNYEQYPPHQFTSWICKNYNSIVMGKYRDSERPREKPPDGGDGWEGFDFSRVEV